MSAQLKKIKKDGQFEKKNVRSIPKHFSQIGEKLCKCVKMPQDDPELYKMPKIAMCVTKMAHNRKVLAKFQFLKLLKTF